MCPGLPLRARHSASLSSRRPPADCQHTCTPSSALYQHHDAAGAIDTTFFPWRPGVSGGGSSSLEQFATSDKSRQLTAAVSETDKSTSVPTVILWLIGSHCCISWTADSLILQRSIHVLHKFCKVPLQRPCCDSVTLIFVFLIIIIIIIAIVIQ